MSLKGTSYNKLRKLCCEHKEPNCYICNKRIDLEDYQETEYIKTKRGTEIFVHTDCVLKWGE